MSVMFVDATPGDKLLKMFRETEDKYRISDECRIKFVAKSGIKLKHILVKKDPFENYCDCKPYLNALAGGITKPNCKKNRIT